LELRKPHPKLGLPRGGRGVHERFPDLPEHVCRERHPGSFGSGSSFAGPCPVGPTVGSVWSRDFQPAADRPTTRVSER
jgi:hypothetical protein